MKTDITELAQSLKSAAEKATPGEWCAYANTKTGTFAIHTPDDSRCGNIINWMGFDGVDMPKTQKSRNAKFIALANPANVKLLVEALELKEEQRANWFQMAQKLGDELDVTEKRIAELESALEVSQGDLSDTEDAMHLWAERAKKAESELESRAVTVEPFRSFVTDADLAALHRFAECCDDPESGGHDLEKEQVLRLEAIGALRRFGCIHWITGFGDVLISITADIKVEDDQ